MYIVLFIVQFLSYLSLLVTVNTISIAPGGCYPESPGRTLSRLGAKALIHDNFAWGKTLSREGNTCGH